MPWRSIRASGNSVVCNKCHNHGNSWSGNRFTRSVKDPAGQGLCDRDYDSRHLGRTWPSGTEYQHAYCSNFQQPDVDRKQQHRLQQQMRFQCMESKMKQWKAQQGGGDSRRHYGDGDHHFYSCPDSRGQLQLSEPCPTACRCVQKQQPEHHYKDDAVFPERYQLYDPTPSAVLDTRYRGMHYQPGRQLGAQVPEERTRMRLSDDGPAEISCPEHLENFYLPLYGYKDWVSRSEHEVWQDCNTKSTIARLPDAPTEHWDFYNEVRMGRPAKKLLTPNFVKCRVLPLPSDQDMSSNPYADQLHNTHTRLSDAQRHQRASTCWC